MYVYVHYNGNTVYVGLVIPNVIHDNYPYISRTRRVVPKSVCTPGNFAIGFRVK